MERAQRGHNSQHFGEELREDEPTATQLAKEFWDFVNYIRCSSLPAPARHVAIEIWLHMRPGKMQANPSATRIAQFTGLSERSVRTAFGLLAKAPFFSVSAPQKGRSKTRTFRAVSFQTMSQLGALMDAKSLATLQGNDDEKGAKVTPFRPKKPAPPAPLPDEKPAPAAVLNNQKPATDAVIEPENLQELPNKPAGAAPEATYRSYQVGEIPECWRSGKPQQLAAMNAYEARAQRQVWVSPTGQVKVDGEFKVELRDEYPLVDLNCGLAASGQNVNTRLDRGALDAMATIRRQFGYMQQDATAKQRQAIARQQSGPPDEGEWNGKFYIGGKEKPEIIYRRHVEAKRKRLAGETC